MTGRRKQVCHLLASEREKICQHKHVAWNGRVPCTGRLQCSMCGQIFTSKEDLAEQRNLAGEACFDADGTLREPDGSRSIFDDVDQ